MNTKSPPATEATSREADLRPLIDLLLECQPVLEVLAGTLNTDKVQSAAAELRDSTKPVDRSIRKTRAALSDALSGILTEPLRHAAGELVVDPLMRLQQSTATLATELHGLRETLNRDDLIAFLQPYAHFRERLVLDAEHKKAIAAYVVSRDFRDPSLRCFIQGSSLAIYLGQQIALSGANGILIHTNSAPFPLTVLNEHCGKSVYSFCAENYDPYCAAWLFPRKATKTEGSLCDLFTRPNDPLTTSFIMPLFLTLDGKMHFQRDDSCFLAEILGREAKRKCVILAVSQRVRDVQFLRDQHIPLFSADIPLANDGKQVELIFSGEFANGLSSSRVRESLRQEGRQIHIRQPNVDWEVSG